MHFEEGQSATNRTPAASKSELLVAVKGGKGRPLLQYMPKGASWVMKTLMQLRRRIGKHQNVQEE